jgi:hypothetical protein
MTRTAYLWIQRVHPSVCLSNETTVTMPWKWQQLLALHPTTSHVELWTTHIRVIIERLRQSKYLPQGSSPCPQKLVIFSYSIILIFCTNFSSPPWALHGRLFPARCCTMQADEPFILHFPPFSSHVLTLLSPDTLFHSNLCSSLNVRDHVSHPYTTAKSKYLWKL